MHVSTTKSYSNISLSEVKEACKIASSDSTYDGEILSLIKASVNLTEKYIGRNIVATTTTLTDNCVRGRWYKIPEPDITLSGVTAVDAMGTTTVITGSTIHKSCNYTMVKFPMFVNAEVLTIVYTSGTSDEIEAVLKRAIIVKIQELMDQGDQWKLNTFFNSKTWERLLAPYTVID